MSLAMAAWARYTSAGSAELRFMVVSAQGRRAEGIEVGGLGRVDCCNKYRGRGELSGPAGEGVKDGCVGSAGKAWKVREYTGPEEV